METLSSASLQWIYLLNFVFLMMHETDAAYWKEWKLFGERGKSLSDKQGLTLFVLARIPICIPLLYGLINIQNLAGLVISLVFSGFIIVHFVIHMRILGTFDGFKWPISYFIQIGMLSLSSVQLLMTLYLLS